MMITALFTVLFSISSFADPLHQNYFRWNQDAVEYFILYSDDGKFVVDQYSQSGQNYQKLIRSKKFNHQEKAINYLNEFKNLSPFSVTPIFRELPQTEVASQVIWSATQSWNLDWEKKYQQWIREEVDTEFFKKNNLATDCADVAISLRWIFSRINKLPIANSLAGSGRLITNETMLKEWKNLPRHDEWKKDELFLKALDYVAENTYTHSLLMDSYPIAINPEHFTEGTHHLYLYEVSGHTRLVYEINQNSGGIFMMSSTTPREVRSLWREYFSDGAPIEQNQGGFLKIRWAEKSAGKFQLRQAQKMPGFSLEQYMAHFTKPDEFYYESVERRVNAYISPDTRVREFINTLKEKLNSRIEIVNEGYLLCRNQNCAPGTDLYEAWSTPHRDQVIKELIGKLHEACWVSSQAELICDLFAEELFDTTSAVMSYSFLLDHFIEDRISSDPRDSINKRWGLLD